MLNSKELQSLKDIEKDIIAHPVDDLDYLNPLFNSSVFNEAEIKEINNIFKLLLNDTTLSDTKKVDYLNNVWKLNFKQKPPTPEEFLTPKWLGQTALDLYPYIKQDFLNFFDVNKPYRHLVLYYPIGTGKSVLCSIIKIYIAVIIYYLRDYKHFFPNLGQSTYIVDGIVSLTQDMAFDLSIKPILNIIGTSEKFHRVVKSEQLLTHMKEDVNTIYYTTAVKGNAIFRIGDLHYHVISEPSVLLGLTTVNISFVELAFMQEKGMKPETVMKLLNDGKGRLWSRFGDHYLARTIIDSSPNDLQNPIDKYIYYDSIKDPKVLRLMGKKWELQPSLFSTWNRTKEVFYIYTGSASKSAKIIEKEDVENYKEDTIEQVPIDIKQLAIDDLNKVLKDYLGVPAGRDDDLISNYDTIEKIFTPSLRNFYTIKHAPASLPPEGLLWDMVKNKLFTYTGKGNMYEFYRAPYLPRFLSIDLSVKHDMCGISMCHIEINRKGEKVYIIDFSLVLMPTKEEINLDSIKYLIMDMYKYGNINFKKISFDQFQSKSSMQYLLRNGFDVERLSVDLTVEPYMSFISYMQQDRVKMGKNIVMKNNLKSLINSQKSGKLKVDHKQGEFFDLTNLDWSTSKAGYYGKDLSDSVVACVTLADMYGTNNADYIWEEILEDEKDEQAYEMNKLLQQLQLKHNLIVKK